MACTTKPAELIAIVGSSCRFAGDATSPSKLWDLLREPRDLSREVPPDRFNGKAFYHRDGQYHGTTNAINGYWLDEDPRLFDARFFGINPKEAEALDPQQRLLLEVTFEAAEAGGIPLDKYRGEPVGVFSACMTQDYETISARDPMTTSPYFAIGNSRAILANRISYFFDFRGPSICIDTACSSGLVALHMAVQSLRDGTCTMACAVGANLLLAPDQFIAESALGMLSPSGKCHMWDSRADGYARGEGVAAIFVKTLSRAIADGDKIEAVVRGIGINADGRGNSNAGGITEPNPEAQAVLIQETYRRAGLEPTNPSDRCQYFEAHGTGTQVGDPREAEGIHNAFFGNKRLSSKQPSIVVDDKLLVGSIKTVIGHTEATSGLAGVLKAVWSMKHGIVPPNLHFDKLNPQVEPFYKHLHIPTAMLPWPDPPPGVPRRASVNSFGFGGSNAHAIVESYAPDIHGTASATPPQLERMTAADVSACQPHAKTNHNVESQSPRGGTSPNISSPNKTSPRIPGLCLPIVVSAASAKSLQDVVLSWQAYLRDKKVTISELNELSWHQYSRRKDLPYRATFSGRTLEEVLSSIDSVVKKFTVSTKKDVRPKASQSPLRILGLFTGQGAQWAGMSASLLRVSSVYRDSIRKLDAVLKACPTPCSWSLEEQITAPPDLSRIQDAAVSQPLCTALQIALVDFLRSIGINFHTVIGHSSGEIAAAYAAGRLRAEDAIIIAYYRGIVAHHARGSNGQEGAMMVTNIPEDEAIQLCNDPSFGGRLEVAASTGPRSSTISGDLEEIKKVIQRLMEEGKAARLLIMGTAYHSQHMENPAAHYIKAMRECGISPLAHGNGITWVSSVHGRPRIGACDLDCQYWADNMVNRVQFYDAMKYTLSQPNNEVNCAIEIGPSPTLRTPFMQTINNLGRDRILYSCPLERLKDAELSVSEFIGFIWSEFGPSQVDLLSYIQQSPIPSLALSRPCEAPPYPFDHSVGYWRESRASRQYHFRTEPPHELLGVRSPTDNAYEMKWQNILRLEKIPWLSHHRFQEQALLPASAYCIMALDAARALLAGRPASLVELQDIEILSGIAIDSEGPGVEIEFSLHISASKKEGSVVNARFYLYSRLADAVGTAKLKKDATGSLRIILGDPSTDVLPARQASLSESLDANPDAFYKSMKKAGLDYTGPFRAVTSIKRRYRHCCTTVDRFHLDDTTMLDISPAALDACFHTTFLSYASPGDGSLWTSFLPTRIGRIQFNLGLIRDFAATSPTSALTVDTYLTHQTYPTKATKASLEVDVAIFNEAGEREIQVENLTVRALANAAPRDDLELYLHTVMDIDPTDQIVGLNDADVDDEDASLAETCRQIAAFDFCHTNDIDATKNSIVQSHSAVTNDFSGAIEVSGREKGNSIDTISFDIHHFDYLKGVEQYTKTLKREGRMGRPPCSKELLNLERSAIQFSVFTAHLGRILKQITHRYPWMNILYLVTGHRGLIRSALTNIGDAFQSLTINGSQDEVIEPIGRAQWREIKFETELRDQVGADNMIDLMIVPSTLLGDSDSINALRRIKEAMQPGGFLVLIDIYPFPQTAGMGDQALLQYRDILEDHGFVREAHGSDQLHPVGSILVRRLLDTKEPGKLKTGISTIRKLLLTGCIGNPEHDQLVTGLQSRLSPHCHVMTHLLLAEASLQDLEGYDTVLMLADLDKPLMSNLTQHRIDQLRTLLRPKTTVLWIIRDALGGNPEHAASLGFTRTIVAEVPTLKLQVLDLDPTDKSPAESIASAFLRLISSEGETNSNPTSISEREIHMRNGRRLVPRVVPWKYGNDRFNASRRVVTRSIKTSKQYIELVSQPALDGSETPSEFSRFQLEEMGPGFCLSPQKDNNITKIQVDYSSLLYFKLTKELSGYVCVGRERGTQNRMLVLSPTNSSYIDCPALDVTKICLKDSVLPGPAIISRLIRSITALASLYTAPRSQRIVLIDPDFEFAKSLAAMLTLERKLTILGTCCCNADRLRYNSIKASELGKYATLCLHPRITTRDLKHALPRDSLIFNFIPENHELSRRIAEAVPESCTLRSGFSLFDSAARVCEYNDDKTKLLWERAVRTAVSAEHHGSLETESTLTVPVSKLQSHSGKENPLSIVDWKVDRDAFQVLSPIINEPLFFANKMYYLFGITRDLGQSLCHLFLENGAKHIVLASRNPKMAPHWVAELNQLYDADIRIERADVTSMQSLLDLKEKTAKTTPRVGGIVNGAMVLEDQMFAQMTIETWNRVLHPKTIGSSNLDAVFPEHDLDFFIMTSSFAAIGGHPGQSNYAAANMYMNGLATNRRRRGLAGSTLNIGVIYGLGFLHREKEQLYEGLEREGYPPISEHCLHHMFIEAIAAGRPGKQPEPFNPFPHDQRRPVELTTGLSRFHRGLLDPLHWHLDPRFGHFTRHDDSRRTDEAIAAQRSFKEELASLDDKEALADLVAATFLPRLESFLGARDPIHPLSNLKDLGVDSMTASQVRNWFITNLDQNIPMMKVLDSTDIKTLCTDAAEKVLIERANGKDKVVLE